MTNKKKLIIAGILLTVAVLIWLFWDDIKKMFSKSDEYVPTENSKDAGSSGGGSGSGSTKKDAPKDTAPKIIPIKEGDSILASKDGANAYSEDMSKVVRTYKKGDYVGTVTKVNVPSTGWVTATDTKGNIRVIMKTGIKKQVL